MHQLDILFVRLMDTFERLSSSRRSKDTEFLVVGAVKPSDAIVQKNNIKAHFLVFPLILVPVLPLMARMKVHSKFFTIPHTMLQ